MTLLSLQKRPAPATFNNFMSDFFPAFPSILKDEFGNGFNGSVPVNIHENENAFVLGVVAPGFVKEDFKIDLENDLLTISAERKEEAENKNGKEIRKEYKYSSFKRSFTLAEMVDANQIGARYVNGILTVSLPKKVEAKASPKQIAVQ